MYKKQFKGLKQSSYLALTINKHLKLYPVILSYIDPLKKAFRNIVGKGENAGAQHFLLFPQCFLSYHRQFLSS